MAATDSNNKRASFSSTGPAVELAAPGVSIYSTYWNDTYASASGTSMASPHVAGAAALVIAAGITDANGNNRINDEVRQKLIDTADDLGAVGKDNLYGYGLVDADEAADIGTPTPINTPPTVSITSPTDGASFESGATISFAGTASDSEDGDLASSLEWTSSRDGQIGTGGSFTKALSGGEHTITAKATDSGGLSGSASLTITIGTTTSKTLKVKSISYNLGGPANKTLFISVKVVDTGDAPIGGAEVKIELSRDGSLISTGTGTTASNGLATFQYKNPKSGTYTTKVTSITKTGYTWDGVTPSNSFTK